MRSVFRHAAILGAVAAMFAAGVIVASAAAGQPGGGGSTGPAPDASGGRVEPAVATTNSAPVPTFQPSPASTVYVPITPCRILDTRLITGGKLGDGTTRSYMVAGSTGFAAQGGNPAGCGIPTNATAISVGLTANGPTANGYLRAWPSAIATEPTATVLTYLKGPGNISTPTLSITPGVAKGITVRNHVATIDLVIDVTGYYVTQTHLIILADGTVWYGTNGHLKSLTHNPNSGLYELTFDRSLDGCNVLTSSNDARDVQAVGSWGGSTLDVSTSHEAAGVFSAADESFQLFIAC